MQVTRVTCSVAQRTVLNILFPQVAQTVKHLPASAGDTGSIPGSGRSPGEGHGNPIQYSCLENPMERGAWWGTVFGVSKSQTQLKQLSHSAHTQSKK